MKSKHAIGATSGGNSIHIISEMMLKIINLLAKVQTSY